MADDRHDQAIGVVGEHDWDRIVTEAMRECNDTIKDGHAGYEAAYQYLASRADRETA